MKKISVILVVIWMIIIFTFSNANATISTKQSDGIVNKIAKIIHYEGNVDNLRYVIRKCAHFTEYFILGILVINACKYNNTKDILVLSIFICMLYACSDEIHQLFIEGRSCKLIDVFIDTLGSSFGILFINNLKSIK